MGKHKQRPAQNGERSPTPFLSLYGNDISFHVTIRCGCRIVISQPVLYYTLLVNNTLLLRLVHECESISELSKPSHVVVYERDTISRYYFSLMNRFPLRSSDRLKPCFIFTDRLLLISFLKLDVLDTASDRLIYHEHVC